MGQSLPLPRAEASTPDSVAALRHPIELALEGSGIGIWDWDVVNGKSSHSRINQRLLGFEDTDEIGGNFAELTARIHPDDAMPMKALVERHLRGETPLYCAEFRVRRKDGSYAWFESRGVVIERGPRGEPLRMVGIHLDISDRKANEQSIQHKTILCPGNLIKKPRLYLWRGAVVQVPDHGHLARRVATNGVSPAPTGWAVN